MYALRKMIQIDTRNLFNNRTWLFLSIGLQIVLVGLLGFLTKPLYGDLMTSFDFYGITIFLFGAANAATFSANAFLEEKIKGANLRVVFSVVPNYFIPVSKAIATFIFTSVSYLVSGVLVKLFFNVNFGGTTFLSVLILFLVFDFFACTVGVFVCTLVRNESIANQINSLVITLLAVLGGFFFNLSSVNQTLGRLSEYLPFSKLKDIMFSLIYDSKTESIICLVISLLGVSVLLLISSCYLFKGEDYL